MLVDKYSGVYEAALRQFSSLLDESDRENLRVKVGQDDGGRYLEFLCPTQSSTSDVRDGVPLRFMGFRTIVTYT